MDVWIQAGAWPDLGPPRSRTRRSHMTGRSGVTQLSSLSAQMRSLRADAIAGTHSPPRCPDRLQNATHRARNKSLMPRPAGGSNTWGDNGPSDGDWVPDSPGCGDPIPHKIKMWSWPNQVSGVLCMRHFNESSRLVQHRAPSGAPGHTEHTLCPLERLRLCRAPSRFADLGGRRAQRARRGAPGLQP